jgi:outer membrane protein assembly factor BamB
MSRLALWTMIVGLLFTATLTGADNWTQFRGSDGSGVTKEGQIPAEWGNDKNIQWKATLPGYGWSSPIVWGDKVFVTAAVADKQKKPSGGFGGGGGGGFGKGGNARPPDTVYKWEVHCLNAADGKLLWKQTAAEQKPTISIHGSNTYATETPVTDGERIYAYFGMTGVFCYDFSGKLLWKAELGSYRMAMSYGTGSSRVLDDGRLFIQCDNEERSFLVALDAKTGKELWRTPRSERTSWSTPLVWKNKMRTEIVCLGTPRVRSYDPATGKQLWELTGMNGQPHASMVAGDDMLYVGTGGRPSFGGGGGGFREDGGRPLFAIKAGASGELTKTSEAIAWSLSQGGPPMASPLLYQGHLYILEQRSSLLNCLDAKTGKQIYRERLPGGRGFTSSPWANQSKIFCLDDSGQTYVVQAGPEFKLLGRNPLSEMSWSSPAMAGDTLFLRTVDHLFCIRQKSAEK